MSKSEIEKGLEIIAAKIEKAPDSHKPTVLAVLNATVSGYLIGCTAAKPTKEELK